MSASLADTLTGLVIDIRRIVAHPDLQVAGKLAEIGKTVDQLALAAEAERGVEPRYVALQATA